MILCMDQMKRRECCPPTVIIWLTLAMGIGAAGTLMVLKRREACCAVKKAGKKCAQAVDSAVEQMFGDECKCEE